MFSTLLLNFTFLSSNFCFHYQYHLFNPNPIPTSRSYFFFPPYIPPIRAVLFFFFFFLVQFFPLNSIDLSFVILISFDFGFFIFIFYFIYNPGYLLVVLKILTIWAVECSKLGWVSRTNCLTNLPIFCLSKKWICLIYFCLENLKTSHLINTKKKKLMDLGMRCSWGFAFLSFCCTF